MRVWRCCTHMHLYYFYIFKFLFTKYKFIQLFIKLFSHVLIETCMHTLAFGHWLKIWVQFACFLFSSSLSLTLYCPFLINLIDPILFHSLNQIIGRSEWQFIEIVIAWVSCAVCLQPNYSITKKIILWSKTAIQIVYPLLSSWTFSIY